MTFLQGEGVSNRTLVIAKLCTAAANSLCPKSRSNLVARFAPSDSPSQPQFSNSLTSTGGNVGAQSSSSRPSTPPSSSGSSSSPSSSSSAFSLSWSPPSSAPNQFHTPIRHGVLPNHSYTPGTPSPLRSTPSGMHHTYPPQQNYWSTQNQLRVAASSFPYYYHTYSTSPGLAPVLSSTLSSPNYSTLSKSSSSNTDASYSNSPVPSSNPPGSPASSSDRSFVPNSAPSATAFRGAVESFRPCI